MVILGNVMSIKCVVGEKTLVEEQDSIPDSTLDEEPAAQDGEADQ